MFCITDEQTYLLKIHLNLMFKKQCNLYVGHLFGVKVLSHGLASPSPALRVPALPSQAPPFNPSFLLIHILAQSR